LFNQQSAGFGIAGSATDLAVQGLGFDWVLLKNEVKIDDNYSGLSN